MTSELVRTLYRYNAWATARILERAARLRPDELAAPSGASFSSVRETLVHIMAAQWIWLARWQGTSPTSLLDGGFPDVASLRARWDQIERETQRFVAGLTDADLAKVVEYRNTRGERWAYPLWQQVVHQVNHATQHRGEVAAALTELGHSPGDLDLLIFIDETEPRR
ncbi:MAG: hypothetical protein DMD87_00895 [Candidatus Rokuibacteriota bacterium]|nr:MAG: hypothetical protein DMD87_00895 [Candidatus Rokubacteria bacterium]